MGLANRIIISKPTVSSEVQPAESRQTPGFRGLNRDLSSVSQSDWAVKDRPEPRFSTQPVIRPQQQKHFAIAEGEEISPIIDQLNMQSQDSSISQAFEEEFESKTRQVLNKIIRGHQAMQNGNKTHSSLPSRLLSGLAQTVTNRKSLGIEGALKVQKLMTP